jgi:hypothetical protein
MALTQGARNKIKSIVQAAKKLLTNEFESQLQQFYGIRTDGSCLMVEELTSRDASIIETARRLRQRLHYLEEGIAGNNKAPEAFRQLIREQAFTILNRFAAVRMSEERNIIRESIRQDYNSEGFQVYEHLAGGSKTADQFVRYSWYIGHVFDELAIDLPAVFDRFSPYASLFPSEKVLLELLTIINDEDLTIYRELGQQPINLWIEDETLGWIYQYYNSREEIYEMRDASGAPRNSRELAVRNQFFTPRYVVQFLVDNSLGRQWYEMTKGKTKLIESCRYMVKRVQEIFLDKGQELPELKVDGANYIEYRGLKDPREILMLDPACGSMHFGLYCFDLFEDIYLEAWDNHPELMQDLRDQYIRDDFIKRIPGYILRYNIHGVDIDPRAIQIAGLSLWLRAQKTYDKLSLEPVNRPAISKSNLVIAEPMPGDANLLGEFTKSLPGPIGKLVRVIWDKMQLAGETGMLLKIEEELKKEIEITKKEYEEFKDSSLQGTLFDSPDESKASKMAAIYGKGQNIDKDFFDTAEEQVLKSLKGFAENAEGEDAFQRLLFADDTVRGFAFIELCRKRYDVIVMNPPFGAGSISTEDYYKKAYPNWAKNILCCFFYRMNIMLNTSGNLGAIFDRTVSVKSSYEKFRLENFIGKIQYVIDTGWGVLDANVETTAYVTNKELINNSLFFDLRDSTQKSTDLFTLVKSNIYLMHDTNSFKKLPNSVIGYYFEDSIINLFNNYKNIRELKLQARDGHNLDSFEHFRLFWEVDMKKSKFSMMYNGGAFSMFYYSYRDVCLYGENGSRIIHHRKTNFRNPKFQLEIGVGYGKRGDYLDAHILKKNTVFTKEGQAISKITKEDSLCLLSFLNSSTAQFLLSLYAGQHKASGYVNLLPLTDSKPYEGVSELIELKRGSFETDETCLETSLLLTCFPSSFKDSEVETFISEVKSKNERYNLLVLNNDKFWIANSNLNIDSEKEINEFRKKRPFEFLYSFGKENYLSSTYKTTLAKELIMNYVGICFGRWSKNIIYSNYNLESLPEYFSELKRSPRIYDGDNIKAFIPDLSSRVVDLINEKWDNESLGHLEYALSFKYIENYITDYNGFFNFHYGRYTISRREAPIYWPIATASNSYVIWIYYPGINESTLFSIVNELVDPKIKEITKEVVILEMNGSAKEYNDQREFLAELEDFKEELLRVAQLPYKPNQDDGVLITAAALHNLFRHTKWKKSTEACWKKLEKGEYDWAHLAYSIWPDRVRKKCVKDLSMAIAHSLEDICEIKPKEKKEKTTKEIKASSQLKID